MVSSIPLNKTIYAPQCQIVATHLTRMIRDGKFRQGEKIPSVRSLAEMLGVGRQVVLSAIAILSRAGLVYTDTKQGTFVSSNLKSGLCYQIGFFNNRENPMYDAKVYADYRCKNAEASESALGIVNQMITEISRLGMKMGGHFESFYGLSGIGDLIVTCASMHSRNRRAGILIGKGCSMDEAMKEVKMVVEGVYSAKAAMGLAARYDVPLPIIEQVNEVLFNGKSARQAMNDLMVRDKKIEITDDIVWQKPDR